MPYVTLEQAYPGIAFRRRTRNWWAWLTRVPPECVHLDTEQTWMATLIPDTLYLRGKAFPQRDDARPEVSLCRACLLGLLERELAAYAGQVVAFEPDAASITQYFFVAAPDFAAAGLRSEVAAAIAARLAERDSLCSNCPRAATWLWLSRREVASLDEVSLIRAAPGQRLCPVHGAATLCDALAASEQANLLYMNVPYGEAGAYLWI